MEPTDSIRNEWFPVADAAATPPGSCHRFELLEDSYLLVVGDGGEVFVSLDTCPHRGAQLSLGSFDGQRLQCPYHGWEFDTTGRCTFQPAHPDRTPPASVKLRSIAGRRRYGLLWVCVGEEPRALPSFPAYDDDPVVNIALEPVTVATSGPRIVENFLDLAHFPFVHAGYLGQVPETAVKRYAVDLVDGELRLSNCTFWQPNPGPRATEGGPVAYDYSISHPYAATLTKIPSEWDGGELGGFSILLVASPRHETLCHVWRVVAVRDPDVDVEGQRAFNRKIFDQDLPIVESQRPKLLPVDPKAEVHQPADAASLAYRRWLVDRGITYGTLGPAPP